MDLYAYLVVLIVALGFVVVLPLLSGTFSYKVHTPRGKGRGGPVSVTSKKQTLREKLSISKNQAPIKIQLSHNGHSSSRTSDAGSETRATLLKKRTFDNDPNTFDYDLTELIEEDERKERREQEIRFQRLAGREQEVSESIV
ncbi:LAME_0G12200g1_1 [Lachancea meyersii CBS 8951]|uniref:LAME_0G12200g1_1 n=1 Tax=Lachancea meyersii CBS 8951 TaxID=1266667 RepID=A0A1G4K9M8_9SACH|nr:LAME_0G12200g1_1 [Lachancea meyersii CBS 8951]